MSDDLDGFGSDEETCFQCDLPPEACNSCPYNLGADLGNFYEGENDEEKDQAPRDASIEAPNRGLKYQVYVKNMLEYGRFSYGRNTYQFKSRNIGSFLGD